MAIGHRIELPPHWNTPEIRYCSLSLSLSENIWGDSLLIKTGFWSKGEHIIRVLIISGLHNLCICTDLISRLGISNA